MDGPASGVAATSISPPANAQQLPGSAPIPASARRTRPGGSGPSCSTRASARPMPTANQRAYDGSHCIGEPDTCASRRSPTTRCQTTVTAAIVTSTAATRRGASRRFRPVATSISAGSTT